MRNEAPQRSQKATRIQRTERSKVLLILHKFNATSVYIYHIFLLHNLSDFRDYRWEICCHRISAPKASQNSHNSNAGSGQSGEAAENGREMGESATVPHSSLLLTFSRARAGSPPVRLSAFPPTEMPPTNRNPSVN